MPYFYCFKILHNLGQGISNFMLSNPLLFVVASPFTVSPLANYNSKAYIKSLAFSPKWKMQLLKNVQILMMYILHLNVYHSTVF